jgi:tripartite-type tricarboxylate transporter receptor subunit TctC
VRALAIFDKQRSPAMPDLPTALEQGTKDLDAYTWYGLFFPKATPDPIITKINAAALQAVKNPGHRAKLQEAGAQFVADDRTSPKYLGEFLKAEIKKWAVPIKAANVVVE